MTKDEVRLYLEYYQDLGVKTIYRRETPAASPEPSIAAPVLVLPMHPSHDNLRQISDDIGDCKQCSLHEGRHRIVLGYGN